MDQNPSSPNAADARIAAAAADHLRVAPILGLAPPPAGGSQYDPSVAASDMAAYVTAFAKRYGPGGTFWAQNQALPYLPVTTYEIGNEPNIPFVWVQDGTHLHWATPNPYLPPDPSYYAQVYEASRNALHLVDPSGVVALVGGLGDSGNNGLNVDVPHDEQVLAALSPGPVDAVAFHPYSWQTSNNLSTLEPDTWALRSWMNDHGMPSVPIELNEVGACGTAGVPGCNVAFSSPTYGSFVAGFLQWALCTPSAGVASYGAFQWQPNSSSDPFLALTNAGSLTPYGQDYLAESRALTTAGCPPPAPGSGAGAPPPPPPTWATAAVTASAHAMQVRLRGIHRRGHRLIVLVRVLPGSGHLTIVAVNRQHRVRFHLIRRRLWDTLRAFAARLPAGRWTIVVSSIPPPGYAAAARLRRGVTVPW